MTSVENRQAEIVEEFGFFEDWMQKYEHIIELGKDLALIDAQHKTEDNLIKGCQSQVWLHAELSEVGRVVFTADSDAIITKGLVGLITRVLTDLTPKEIISADLHFINEIGLHDHLSATRSNGLAAMIKQMKMYGLAFSGQTA
ncbi:MAG: cysteine desulfuration protein SufE [Flavobacteriales bacterium]|jgi:cysteine desulfuration protein SufE